MEKFSLFVIVCFLTLFSFSDAKRKYKDCPDCKSWSVIVVGGSFSGIGAVRDIYKAKVLSEQSGQYIKVTNMSDVLLLEYKAELGGDTRSRVSPNVNGFAAAQVDSLYGYEGPFYYDIGTQRIPLLTCRKQRAYAIDANSIQEFTPYLTTEYTRGKVVRCPSANFKDYQGSSGAPDPYGMPGSCTDAPEFIGDNSVPWKYDEPLDEETVVVGPGYNYSTFANWAYVDKSPLSVINNYILYDGPNPVTCPDSDYESLCQEEECDCYTYREANPASGCGNCFADEIVGTFNVKAALIKTIGVEPTAAFIQDYGGFYSDFEQRLFNATSWRSYWLREYDTNLIYGYTVGGMQRGYLYKLATPLLQEKNVKTSKLVKDISWAQSVDGEMGVVVTTDDCTKYYGDFLIYTDNLNSFLMELLLVILRRNYSRAKKLNPYTLFPCIW